MFFRLKNKENSIVRDYVLPDYANIRKGYAKSQEDSTGKPMNSEQVIFFNYFLRKSFFWQFLSIFKLIRLNNERFCVPELLFNPSDIGIKEMGISEAIVNAVESLSKGEQIKLVDFKLLVSFIIKFFFSRSKASFI